MKGVIEMWVFIKLLKKYIWNGVYFDPIVLRAFSEGQWIYKLADFSQQDKQGESEDGRVQL